MSGWRAGVVAVVVGGLVLLAGWLVNRSATAVPGPDPPEAAAPDDEPAEVDNDMVLACTETLVPACSAAAAALGVASEDWSPGDALPERGAVLAALAELPAGGDAPVEVASSPVVVAGWLTRWQPLERDCGGAVDVTCLAGRLAVPWSELGAPSGWGEVTIGLADPNASEAGMAAWSLLAPVLEGGGLASALRITADDDASLMEEFVLVGDSRANFVVTTESAVVSQFQNAIGRGGRLALGYPPAGPWVAYGAVGSGRGAGDLLTGLLSEPAAAAFTESGLRPVGGLVGTPHEAMGEPGDRAPAPDDAARATLASSWEELT